MTEVNMTGPVSSSADLRAAVSHGAGEYRFYTFPNGNPPGQIKAFVIFSKSSYEKRVPFGNLPTKHLQETFVELTGKKAEEIGVIVME